MSGTRSLTPVPQQQQYNAFFPLDFYIIQDFPKMHNCSKNITPQLANFQMRQTPRIAWAKISWLLLHFTEHAGALNCSLLNSEPKCQICTEVHFRARSGTFWLSVRYSCWHWCLLKPNCVVKEKGSSESSSPLPALCRFHTLGMLQGGRKGWELPCTHGQGWASQGFLLSLLQVSFHKAARKLSRNSEISCEGPAHDPNHQHPEEDRKDGLGLCSNFPSRSREHVLQSAIELPLPSAFCVGWGGH